MEKRENNASLFSSGFNKFRKEKQTREDQLREEQNKQNKKFDSLRTKTKVNDDIIQDIHLIGQKKKKEESEKENEKSERITKENLQDLIEKSVEETKKIETNKKNVITNNIEEVVQLGQSEINQMFQDSLQIKLEKLNNKFSYKFLSKNNESLNLFLNEYNNILNHCTDEIKQEMYINTSILKSDIIELFGKVQTEMNEINQMSWNETEEPIKEKSNELKEVETKMKIEEELETEKKKNTENTKDTQKITQPENENKMKQEKRNLTKETRLQDLIDFLIHIVNKNIYKIIINSNEKKEVIHLSGKKNLKNVLMEKIKKQIKEKRNTWELKWKQIQMLYEQMEARLQNCIFLFEKNLTVCMNKLDNEIKILENKIKTHICISEKEAIDLIKKETTKYKESFMEFLNYFDNYIMNIYNSLHTNYKKCTSLYHDTFEKCSKEQCVYICSTLQHTFVMSMNENSSIQVLIQRFKENYEEVSKKRDYFKEDQFLSKFWSPQKLKDPYSFLTLYHLSYIMQFKEIERTVEQCKESIVYILFSQSHLLYYTSKNVEYTQEEEKKAIKENTYITEKEDETKTDIINQKIKGKDNERNPNNKEHINKRNPVLTDKEIPLEEVKETKKKSKKHKKKEANKEEIEEINKKKKEETGVHSNITNSLKDNEKLFNQYIENIVNYYKAINLRDDCFLLTFFQFMLNAKQDILELTQTLEQKRNYYISTCKTEFKSFFEPISKSLKEYSQKASMCLVCTQYEQLQTLITKQEEQLSNIQSQIETIRKSMDTKNNLMRQEMKCLLSNQLDRIIKNIGILHKEIELKNEEKSKKKDKDKEEIKNDGNIRWLKEIEEKSFLFESIHIIQTIYQTYQYNIKYILYTSFHYDNDHMETKDKKKETINHYKKCIQEKQEKEGLEKIKTFLNSDKNNKIPSDIFDHATFLFSKNIQEIQKALEKQGNFQKNRETEYESTQKYPKEIVEIEQEPQEKRIYFDKLIEYEDLFFNWNVIKEHFRELVTVHIDFLKKYFLETVHKIYKEIEHDNYFDFGESVIEKTYDKNVLQNQTKIEQKKSELLKEYNEINMKFENIVKPVKEIIEVCCKDLSENESDKAILQEIKKMDLVCSGKIETYTEFKMKFDRYLQNLLEGYNKEEEIWSRKINQLKKEIKKAKVNMKIQLDIKEGSWINQKLCKEENTWIEVLNNLEKKKKDIEENRHAHWKQYKEKYKEIMLQEKNKVKPSKNTPNQEKGKELSLNEEIKNELTLFYVLIYYIKHKIRKTEQKEQTKKKKIKKMKKKNKEEKTKNTTPPISNTQKCIHENNKNENVSKDRNVNTNPEKEIQETINLSSEQNTENKKYIEAKDKYKEVNHLIYDIPIFLKISEICSLHINKKPPLFEHFFIYKKIKRELSYLLFEKAYSIKYTDTIHFDIDESELENTGIEPHQGKPKEKNERMNETTQEKDKCFTEDVVIRKYCDLKILLYISVYIIYYVCKFMKLSDPSRQWLSSSKKNYIHFLFLSYDLSYEIYKDVILSAKKQSSKPIVKELKYNKSLLSSFIYSTTQQVCIVELIHVFSFEKKLVEEIVAPYFSHVDDFTNDDINKNWKQLQMKYAKDVIQLSIFWKILAKKLLYHIFNIIYKKHKEIIKKRSNFLQSHFKKAFHKTSNELSLQNEDIAEIQKRKIEMRKLTTQYTNCIQNFLSNHLYSFFENLYNNLIFVVHLMNCVPSLEIDSTINELGIGENDMKGNNMKLKNEGKHNFLKIEYIDKSENYDVSDLKRKIKRVYNTQEEEVKKRRKTKDNLLNRKDSKRNYLSLGSKIHFPKETLFLEYMDSNTPIVQKLENKIEKYMSKMYRNITKKLNVKKKEVILMISEDKRINRKFYEYEDNLK